MRRQRRGDISYSYQTFLKITFARLLHKKLDYSLLMWIIQFRGGFKAIINL